MELLSALYRWGGRSLPASAVKCPQTLAMSVNCHGSVTGLAQSVARSRSDLKGFITATLAAAGECRESSHHGVRAQSTVTGRTGRERESGTSQAG